MASEYGVTDKKTLNTFYKNLTTPKPSKSIKKKIEVKKEEPIVKDEDPMLRKELLPDDLDILKKMIIERDQTIQRLKKENTDMSDKLPGLSAKAEVQKTRLAVLELENKNLRLSLKELSEEEYSV